LTDRRRITDMQLEFIGQSVRNPNDIAADPARLYNCHRVGLSDGRKTVRADAGTVKVAQLDGVFCRAMGVVDERLFIVHGGQLLAVTSVGTVSVCGVVPDSPETTISGNNGRVTVAAAGRYFVWDGTTLTEPAAGAFSDFASVTFLTQRTVLAERRGRRVQWSSVTAPATLGGLAFGTAETKDNNNIRAMAIDGELWIFKTTSLERWYPDTAGFAPIPGGAVDKGLKAYNLLAEMDTGACFVSNDDKVMLVAAGGAMQKISIPALEVIISEETPEAVFYYQDRSAEMCVIAFRNRPAWVFDLAAGEWHERGEGKFGPWSMRRAAVVYGASWVCNDLGELCRFEPVNVDHSGPLIRVAVSPNLSSEGARFNVSKFRINGRFGYTGEVMLRVSRDRGVTWGAPKVRALGDAGTYRTQVLWRALGHFRDFCVEVSMSNPTETPFESVVVIE
jgi:hypothetical protein